MKTFTPRKTYYEVLDHVINAITHRFDQDGYKVLCKLEELLCNAKSKLEDYSDALQLYAGNFNQECLAMQLFIIHSNVGIEVRNLNGGAKIKRIPASLNSVEHELYTEVIKLTKIILVMPVTNAVK